MLELVPYTDPILHQRGKEFDFQHPEADPAKLAGELLNALYQYRGLGISACQLGIPFRVFAMRAEPPFVCFNPRVVWQSEETESLEEGCLSYPGVVIRVERPKSIRCRFQTPSGVLVTQSFVGMSARVFMHEMQHMDGLTPFTGASRLRVDQALKKAKKLGFEYTRTAITI